MIFYLILSAIMAAGASNTARLEGNRSRVCFITGVIVFVTWPLLAVLILYQRLTE